jgi:uncharacterized protein (TIGR02217 family)
MFNETAIFPGCAKFGFSSSPNFAVEIVETAGGIEYRDEKWAQSKRLVLVTVGPGPGGEPEVEELMRFYEAHGGPTDGFRFLDPTQYKTVGIRDTPTAFDQPLIAVDGGHQLALEFTVGAVTRYRYIYKPTGTILLSGGGSVDYTTGLVTGGAGGTWGGEYHIPCRFDGEFPVQIVNYRSMSVSFALRELPLEEAGS